MRNAIAFATLLLVLLTSGIIIFMINADDLADEVTARLVLFTENTPPIPTQPPPPPRPERPAGGWRGVFDTPTVFTSEELEEMLALSPHYTQTRHANPHPTRKMTNAERTAWIAEYEVMGGMNAQELEMYKIVNEIRAEYGLPPFVLCPRLSMASRLFSYLQVRYHTVGHNDYYYYDMMARANFFGAFGSLYKENANSQQWFEFEDGRIEYVYLSPQELVDGWMSSDGHRAHILTEDTTHAGFGVDSGKNRVVPTMKTMLPMDD